MQPVFQSSFLQALGFAIANSLWQTAILWLVYMSVNSLFALSAAAKYRLAVAAQLISFSLFLTTLQLFLTQFSNTGSLTIGTQPIRISPNTEQLRWLIKGLANAELLLPYVSMAYLVIMLVLCLRWVLGYRQTQQIRRKGLSKIPVEWRLFVNRISDQLAIKKEIRLFLSASISTPLTIGFLKPVILIPMASLNHLSADQMEAVLLHELAHIKRYDYLLNIILSVVEMALFFNPFTQLFSNTIHKERENSCDDWVLQFKYNARAYAAALLQIAYLQSAPALAMAASGKKNELLVRIKRMIDKKEDRLSYRKQLLAFLIVTGLLSSIAWLNPKSGVQNQKKSLTVNTKLPQKKVQIQASASLSKKVAQPSFTSLIKSIPPLVAGALEAASAELAADDKQEVATHQINMEAINTEHEKNLYVDTAIVSKKMISPFAKDVSAAFHEMNIAFGKGKLAIEHAVRGREIALIDRQKMQKDIQLALAAVNEVELKKLMVAAIQFPEIFFELPDRNGSAIIENIVSDIDINPEEIINTPHTGHPSFAAKPDIEKMKSALSKIIRIKKILLKKNAEKSFKIISTVAVDNAPESDRIIIRIQ